MNTNEKTDLEHWESAWEVRPRPRFPSKIHVGTSNIMRLLKGYLRPGLRYIEIGCAPGKILAWVGREIGGEVSGIDYSPRGSETSKWLCSSLGVRADIRCEDATKSSFVKGGFDLVFSCGLIEHFDDPTEIVSSHVELLAADGVALILIPNYSGLYLMLQKLFDEENLDIHNLSIMTEAALVKVAPVQHDLTIRAFYYGRFSPWIISFSAKLGAIGGLISWTINLMALLQPIRIRWLCPLIVLEIRRN
jgi:2-polyprenyl-3-methyl-5-hydroxy-6-metoxy-1,4-benzoquinol methylase